MNPSREEALFALALKKPAEKRPAFLDAVCEDDDVLRQRLEALLAAHEQTESLLATQSETARPTIKLDLADAPDETVGQTLGRYKLLERVGEGGCGVVYVAEQTEPVRRRVALKVIKLGMDTKQVVARFEAERQALAMMDHPNIAKVLDAGTTGASEQSSVASDQSPSRGAKREPLTTDHSPLITGYGRPYFVMELVRGIKITDYCDQANLSTKERLDLFVKVCQAIQHAHQKGIIHRDIKPSNILVTLHDGVPVPKVIDFGIAKATEGRLTDATVYTQLHQFIGTPAYMSPEQAEMSGLDIDTRSDIYSLGVLLYELLAGSTPFDATELMASGIDAMRKTIREKEPMRPSTKLSQTLVAAEVRRLKSPASDKPATEEEVRASSRRLLRIKEALPVIRGDLDWIVMKCLEKDRTRRYETANGLAADLKRHLCDEPVVARPPSAAYRFQKAFRRNKLIFAAGMAIAVALVLGVVVSTVMFLREQLARQDAARQRDEARWSAQAAIVAQAKAERERERARSLSYASDMNVAWRTLEENNLAELTSLLESHIPGPGDSDLRGWEWRYFWQACRGDQLWTLGPMAGDVWSLALLREGRLATGIGGGPAKAEVRVWDLDRRNIVRRVPLAPDDFSGLAVSPDGRQLAVATWRAKVRFLDAISLETIGELHHDKAIWNVAYSPDGKLLSAHGEDVSVWEFAARKRLWATNVPYGSGSTATFSPDGKWVACQLGDGGLALLGATDGALIRRTESVASLTSRVAVSRDGRWLAAGDWGGAVHLTDPTLTRIRVLTNHQAAVRAVAFSPNSRQLATAGSDRLVKLWDVESGRETATLRGHHKEIRSLVYAADGQRLFSGARDGTVHAWPAYPSRQEPMSNLPVNFVRALSRDGQFMAGFETNGVLHVVSVKNQRESGRVAIAEELGSLAIGPDGRELAAGFSDGTARVWDLTEGKVSWAFQAHSNKVDVVVLSPDGSRLATAARGGEVRVWDLNGKRLVLHRVLGAVGYRVNDMVFAHDGSMLVVPAHRKIHFVSLRSDGHYRTVEMEETYSIDISRDGSLVAAGMDEEVRVWEVSSLRQVALLRGGRGVFVNVSFSPDHHRLVASDATGVTWLWDLATGREVGRFGPNPSFFGSRFQPNGDTVVLQGGSSRFDWIRLLHAPSWEEIAAAEAKDPPAPGYGGQGKAETKKL